jgi:hypothetical protein
LLVATGLHFAAVSAPSFAWAQQPAPAPAPQPVPYPTAPVPVPYGQTSPAPAPTTTVRIAPGSDVIRMKNGGILRGTIIDAIPNAQARIQLATGEIATVPWQEIDRIEHAGEQPQPRPGPTAPSGPPAPPAPPPRPGGTIFVHIDGPEEARLQQYSDADGSWSTVCSVPCDQPLPAGADYRITGGGIKQSAAFNLRGQNGDRNVVTVNAASKAWFVVGVVAIPVGGLVGFVGLLVGLAGSLASSVNSSVGDSQGTRASDAVAATGWTMFGIGAASLVAGIVLVASNVKTSVNVDQASAQAGLLVLPTVQHTPTWREATPEQKAAPQVVGIPVFTGSF